MTTGNQIFFTEDSDADSVATDTTQGSEQQESYNVEKILAEDSDYEGTGQRAYLLKWERYPLYRATWEPPDNIDDDILVQQWEEHKRLVRAGKATAFDLAEFDRALNRWYSEGVERQRRRKEKRRKRGIPVSPNKEAEDSEYEELDVVKSPKRRRIRTNELDSGDEDVIASAKKTRQRPVRTSPVKRKGVAQKLSGSRHPFEISSDEGELRDGDEEGNDSEPNSLFDEGSQPIYSELAKSKKPVFRPSNGTGSGTTSSVKAPTSAPKPIKPVAAPKTVANPAARKSAPVPVTTAKPATTGKTAKRTPNIFANWADAKKRKQRARVGGDIPKDSADPKFVNLAIQNNFRTFSRNEPAPNLNALTIVDPKTGKAQPDRAASLPKPSVTPIVVPAPTSRVADEIHSAYGRRTPPRGRQRSITPPSPEPRNAQDMSVHRQVQPPSGQITLPSTWRRTRTCWHWMNNDCIYTEETCRFAHRVIDTPQPQLQEQQQQQQQLQHQDQPQMQQQQQQLVHLQQIPPPPPPPPPAPIGYSHKKLTTCYYWQEGRCNKPDDVCEFAHWDTGVHSKAAHEQRMRTTCHFWRMGICTKSADECGFAHEDTGVYAPEPGTFKRSSAAASVQSSAGMEMLQSSSRFTGANAEPVGGFPLSSISTAEVEYGIMAPTSATSESASRAVRFQLPQAEGAAFPQLSNDDLGSLPVQISVRSESDGQLEKVGASLEMIGLKRFEGLLYPVSKGVYLFPDRMVTAKDLQACLPQLSAGGTQWPAGSVVPQAASVAMTDKLAECCKLHASGFVSIQDRYTLLLYPSNSEEWRFVETTNAPAVPNTSLRFRIFPPIADFHRSKDTMAVMEPALLQHSASVIVGKALLGLDPSSVLQRSADQKMFIAWPAHRHQELTVLVKYFQDLNCRVYHSGTPGAWAYFRGKYAKGSVVIIHPETPFWEIPMLHSFLVAHDAKFFSMSMRQTIRTDDDQQPALSCERRFPLGRVTYITDDVFVYHPEKATGIINAFVAANATKPVGGENDRIAARPGVKVWLRKLAQEQATERGRPDARWLELYESLCTLCPPDAEDPYDLPNPLPSSNLVSIPAEELPSFYGLWEQDEERATNKMVEWFAGWTVLNADKFRRFFVCYEPKGGEFVQDENGRFRVDADPRGWSKKYQYIGVLRPDEVLKKPKQKK
ncbi:hypothetical protein LTR85_008070 [Meristemomyces frigidus]|nr:hypothetical protein LTR85_008070 [Meristemomyces frigidus]